MATATQQGLASVGGISHTCFPPLRAGLAVPVGSFLNPKTTGAEGGLSYLSRSGFEGLATSSYFVARLRSDVDALLDTFVERWMHKPTSEVQEAELDTASSISRKGKRKRQANAERKEVEWVQEVAEATSPFKLFSQLFHQQGWHRAQLCWSEHEVTRRAIYDTLIRILTLEFRPLKEALVVDDGKIRMADQGINTITNQNLLRACGALFAVHLVRSTTSLNGSDRLQPGKQTRVAIEADLLHSLCALPTLASSILSKPRDADGLRPIDDVYYILQGLLGSTNAPGDSLCDPMVDVLLPTDYSARPPIVSNFFSTKAEVDRRHSRCGFLIDERTKQQLPLNRAESAHALLHDALGMPQLEPREARYTEEETNRRGTRRAHMLQTDRRLRIVRSITSKTKNGPGQYAIALPSTGKQHKLERAMLEVTKSRERYQQQAEVALGIDGVAGPGFAERMEIILDEPAVRSGARHGQVDQPALPPVHDFISQDRLNAEAILNYCRVRTRQGVKARLRECAQKGAQNAPGHASPRCSSTDGESS